MAKAHAYSWEVTDEFWAQVRAVDTRSGVPAHRAALWHQAAGAHDGVVPRALGLYPTKADEEGLRAVAQCSQEMAR